MQILKFFTKKNSKQKLRKSLFSKFPQISRKKTAKILKSLRLSFSLHLNRALKICFLFFVFCYLFLNLHTLLFPANENLDQTKKAVLNSPFQSKPHEDLARTYLEAGDLKSAEKELNLAKNLFSPDRSSLEILEKDLKKAKESPSQIQHEISFWEKIIKEKPDYRDAYFQLAILSYQLGKIKKAQTYLQKTLDLDPNFEPARKLEKMLKE